MSDSKKKKKNLRTIAVKGNTLVSALILKWQRVISVMALTLTVFI